MYFTQGPFITRYNSGARISWPMKNQINRTTQTRQLIQPIIRAKIRKQPQLQSPKFVQFCQLGIHKWRWIMRWTMGCQTEIHKLDLKLRKAT